MLHVPLTRAVPHSSSGRQLDPAAPTFPTGFGRISFFNQWATYQRDLNVERAEGTRGEPTQARAGSWSQITFD